MTNASLTGPLSLGAATGEPAGEDDDSVVGHLALSEEDASAEPRATIEHMFASYYVSLVRAATRVLDDHEAAEDVVQDVFARLGARPDLAAARTPRLYLHAAVMNGCRSVLRRRRLSRLNPLTPSIEASAADAPVLVDDENKRILAAVQLLPSRQRQVVVLRYYSDFSIAECATALHITPAAVKTSLTRALKSLQNRAGEING